MVQFEKPKGDPSAWPKPATTVLSPYLKFGCLSARLFWAKLHQVRPCATCEGLPLPHAPAVHISIACCSLPGAAAELGSPQPLCFAKGSIPSQQVAWRSILFRPQQMPDKHFRRPNSSESESDCPYMLRPARLCQREAAWPLSSHILQLL